MAVEETLTTASLNRWTEQGSDANALDKAVRSSSRSTHDHRTSGRTGSSHILSAYASTPLGRRAAVRSKRRRLMSYLRLREFALTTGLGSSPVTACANANRTKCSACRHSSYRYCGNRYISSQFGRTASPVLTTGVTAGAEYGTHARPGGTPGSSVNPPFACCAVTSRRVRRGLGDIPRSAAGKTQEKPKQQFPTLRAWVIPSELLSRNRAKR